MNSVTAVLQKKQRGLEIITGLLIAFFIFTGLQQFWSDSEIWGIEKSRLWWEGSPYVSILQKPLFHIFWYPTLFFEHLADRMLLARMIYFGFLSLSIFLICRKSQKPLWNAIFILSSPFFLLDAPPVRSDLLALPFLLWAYDETLSLKPRLKNLILAVAVAILFTPKALLFLLPLVIWIPERTWWIRPRRITLMAFSALIICFATWSWKASLWNYGGRLFLRDEYGADFFDLSRFVYVFRFAFENLVLMVLLATSFWKKSEQKKRRAAFFLLLLIMIFPDKLPFFLCTGALLFFRLLDPVSLPIFNHRSWLIGILALIGFVYAAPIAWKISAKDQSDLIAQLEQLKKTSPQVSIFDGLGIFAHAKTDPFFLGPAEKQHNNEMTEKLLNETPDIVLVTPRLQTYTSIASRLPSLEYQEIDTGVWVRSMRISRSENHSQVLDRARLRMPAIWQTQKAVLISVGALNDPANPRIEISMDQFLQTDSWRPREDAFISLFPDLQGLSAQGSPEKLLRFQHPKRFTILNVE